MSSGAEPMPNHEDPLYDLRGVDSDLADGIESVLYGCLELGRGSHDLVPLEHAISDTLASLYNTRRITSLAHIAPRQAVVLGARELMSSTAQTVIDPVLGVPQLCLPDVPMNVCYITRTEYFGPNRPDVDHCEIQRFYRRFDYAPRRSTFRHASYGVIVYKDGTLQACTPRYFSSFAKLPYLDYVSAAIKGGWDPSNLN